MRRRLAIARRLLQKFWRGEITLVELSQCRGLQFSQFGEDVFLDRYFARQPTGVYVDVGAFHPLALSNTYRLYRRGWRGVNIEPNPEGYEDLRRYRQDDVNVNLAVSCREEYVPFTCDNVFSGIADSRHLYRGRNPDALKIRVKAKPLSRSSEHT